MILEPRKIKSDTVSTVSPSISHEVVGPDVSKRKKAQAESYDCPSLSFRERSTKPEHREGKEEHTEGKWRLVVSLN